MNLHNIVPSFRAFLIMISSVFVLSGCLMEEQASETDEPGDDSSGEILRNHDLSGSVGDGPVTGADIRIRANDGSSLGSTTSDSTANFAITVKTLASHYPLNLEATGGTDLVTQAAPDFTLRGAALSPDAQSTANLNPFTTLAMELAADLSGGASAANIDSAIGIVTDRLGSGLDGFASAGPLDTPIDGSNVAEVVKASEAVGEVVRRTRDALGAVGRSVSGNGVVIAIGSDLTDGVLDGRGGARADARIAAVANLVVAQVMMEAMQNRLEVQGTDATARMEAAIAQVYTGTPDPALDELPVTASMLDAAIAGVLAGTAWQSSASLDEMLAQLGQLQPGMSPAQVTAVLVADDGSTLDNMALAVAGASAAELEIINAVARTGEVPQENRAPEISGQPAKNAVAGSAYRFVPQANDADGDTLQFSISGRPSWAWFNTSTGALTGTPSESDVGSSAGIVISVSDGEASDSLPAFTLTVLTGVSNAPPEIGGTPPTSVLAGSAYSFTPTASDADGDTLVFSINNAPSWASFASATGRLSGTPGTGDAGTYSGISISVTDGTDTATLPSFSIVVTVPAPVNSAPVISGTPPGSVIEGELYRFQPSASDADDDTLTFSISGRPSWATFDNATGELEGTPDGGDVGMHGGIVISVSDGQDSDALPSFSITVEAAVNAAPQISGNPPPSVLANNDYAFTPQASDSDGDSLTFSVEALPSWASFNEGSGRLYGTPGDGDVGNYSGITITVSDGEDSASLGPFTISVEAVTLGSATLSWTAPTQNTDGTPLTDLAGYRIYWGTKPGSYPDSVTIDQPGVTMYVVENLVPGTYEFVSTAVNADGVESDYSNPATKTVE
ncbi:MAG: putative Ig domain-containing protein [Woeseia sp.]